MTRDSIGVATWGISVQPALDKNLWTVNLPIIFQASPESRDQDTFGMLRPTEIPVLLGSFTVRR